jgi:hypothetical protein
MFHHRESGPNIFAKFIVSHLGFFLCPISHGSSVQSAVCSRGCLLVFCVASSPFSCVCHILVGDNATSSTAFCSIFPTCEREDQFSHVQERKSPAIWQFLVVGVGPGWGCQGQRPKIGSAGPWLVSGALPCSPSACRPTDPPAQLV